MLVLTEANATLLEGVDAVIDIKELTTERKQENRVEKGLKTKKVANVSYINPYPQWLTTQKNTLSPNEW